MKTQKLWLVLIATVVAACSGATTSEEEEGTRVEQNGTWKRINKQGQGCRSIPVQGHPDILEEVCCEDGETLVDDWWGQCNYGVAVGCQRSDISVIRTNTETVLECEPGINHEQCANWQGSPYLMWCTEQYQ